MTMYLNRADIITTVLSVHTVFTPGPTDSVPYNVTVRSEAL